MKNLILALSLLMVLPAPTLLQSQEPTDIPRARQQLLPGDQIRITVWRSPEFSGDFLIASNGTVTHPLYRDVVVTSIPLAEAEERLRVFLTRYITTPQFVIEPLVRIIVAGEVRSPNIYGVPPETTIAQAVALAGGVTERGQLRDVRIMRDRQIIRMDLSDPQSNASVLQIRSGDQVTVNRRSRSVMEWLGPVTSSVGMVAAILNLALRF